MWKYFIDLGSEANERKEKKNIVKFFSLMIPDFKTEIIDKNYCFLLYYKM